MLFFLWGKIANYFNEFFTTVASILVNKLPTCLKIFDTNSDIFKHFYKNRNPTNETFCLKTVSEDFIYKELDSLNLTKSTGVDNIPTRFLKDGASFLKISILYIRKNLKLKLATIDQ